MRTLIVDYNNWKRYAGETFVIKDQDGTQVYTGTVDASGCGAGIAIEVENDATAIEWFIDGTKKLAKSLSLPADYSDIISAIDSLPSAVASVEIGDSVNPVYPEGQWANASSKLNLVPSVPAVFPVPAPADSSLCKPYGYFKKPNQTPWTGLKFNFYLISPEPTSGGRVIASRTVTIVADANGEIGTSTTESDNIKLDRNDAINPPGTTWNIVCVEANVDVTVTLDSGLFDLGSLVRTS